MSDIENEKSEASKPTRLYLCDGQACKDSEKNCCYRLIGIRRDDEVCYHTSNPEHSLSKRLSGYIPTKFYPAGNGRLLIEHYDYNYAKPEKLKAFMESKKADKTISQKVTSNETNPQ